MTRGVFADEATNQWVVVSCPHVDKPGFILGEMSPTALKLMLACPARIVAATHVAEHIQFAACSDATVGVDLADNISLPVVQIPANLAGHIVTTILRTTQPR